VLTSQLAKRFLRRERREAILTMTVGGDAMQYTVAHTWRLKGKVLEFKGRRVRVGASRDQDSYRVHLDLDNRVSLMTVDYPAEGRSTPKLMDLCTYANVGGTIHSRLVEDKEIVGIALSARGIQASFDGSSKAVDMEEGLEFYALPGGIRVARAIAVGTKTYPSGHEVTYTEEVAATQPSM
jgi:hypothetical protein